MEVAVFGGTFDPPTLAHEGIVRACLQRKDIDEVWLMPSGVRRDKPGMESDQARLAMLGLLQQEVFHNHHKLTISDFELRLPQPTMTYTTVKALSEAYPEKKFWFVFGADSYANMHTWENGEKLRMTLGMLVVARQGYSLPPETENVRHLEVAESKKGISSSKVREAIREKHPISHYVSDPIAQFVTKQGLYAAVQ